MGLTPATARLAGLILAALVPSGVLAEQVIGGPVAARVERVIDGDTVEVRAAIWPGTEVLRSVRTRGMDAPEITRSTCERERVRGEAARAFLIQLVEGKTVYLSDIADDKYGGRVDARVTTEDGRDVAELLISRQLAAPEGHRPREALCAF